MLYNKHMQGSGSECLDLIQISVPTQEACSAGDLKSSCFIRCSTWSWQHAVSLGAVAAQAALLDRPASSDSDGATSNLLLVVLSPTAA